MHFLLFGITDIYGNGLIMQYKVALWKMGNSTTQSIQETRVSLHLEPHLQAQKKKNAVKTKLIKPFQLLKILPKKLKKNPKRNPKLVKKIQELKMRLVFEKSLSREILINIIPNLSKSTIQKPN